MALTFGTAASGSTATNGTTLTVSLNNTKEDVIAYVSIIDNAENAFTITATYAGVAMTEIATVTGNTTTKTYRSSIFLLQGATPGTNNIVFTSSLTCTGFVGGGIPVTAGSSSISVGTPATNTAGCTVALLTTIANSTILSASHVRSNTTPPTLTAEGSQTELYNTSSASATTEIKAAAYYRTVTTVTTYTVGAASSDATGDMATAVEIWENTAPTTALNTPADAASTSDTTPTFNFTGTDAQADEVEYELQVDALTFPSPISIEDDFNDNSVSSAKWTPWTPGDYVESSARMNITSTTAASYKGGDCVGTYDLTGKSLAMEVTNVTTGLTDYGNYMQLYLNASNSMTLFVYNDTLTAEKQIATSFTTLASTAYNSSTHRWWRIREASGTVYYDISADGKTWTNFASASNPFALTALTVSIFMGTDSANGGTETFSFDNLNIYPATIDAFSFTDGAYTAGHPFASGVATDYVTPSPLSVGTYYWRARAIDPLGSNTYGAWATARTLTITADFTPRFNPINHI